MKFTLLTFFIFGILSCNSAKNILPDASDSPMTVNPTNNPNQLTYLALGDSYTIGEGVSESGRYPNQLVAKLNSDTGKFFTPAKIIAQTGWTVDDLEEGIDQEEVRGKTYDLVTLLTGVNNQYRGRPVEDFKKEFEAMLLRAISFAGVNSNHVVVLSIPDWGITAFATAKEVDKNKVTKEINEYNLASKTVSEKHGVTYIDLTKEYRKEGDQLEMLAADGLHPSAKMYEIWTEKLFKHVRTINF